MAASRRGGGRADRRGGDIDRGGAIASIVGTEAVIDPADAAMIRVHRADTIDAALDGIAAVLAQVLDVEHVLAIAGEAE